MLVTRGDGLLTTEQAARLVGAAPATIRTWKRRGQLRPAGLSERGWPLYERTAVIAAEKKITDNWLATKNRNPRQVRGRNRAAEAAGAA